MELEDIGKQMKDLEKQKQEIDSKLSQKRTVYNEIKQKNLWFLHILRQCSTPNKYPTSTPHKEVNPYSYAPNYVPPKLPSTPSQMSPSTPLKQATPSSTPLKQDSPLKMSSTPLKHPPPSCSVLSTVKVENVKRSLEEEFDEDIKGDEELLMVSKEMKSPDNNTEPTCKIDDEKCKADNVAEVTDAVANVDGVKNSVDQPTAKVNVKKNDNITFEEAQSMLIIDNNNIQPTVKVDDENDNADNVPKIIAKVTAAIAKLDGMKNSAEQSIVKVTDVAPKGDGKETVDITFKEQAMVVHNGNECHITEQNDLEGKPMKPMKRSKINGNNKEHKGTKHAKMQK